MYKTVWNLIVNILYITYTSIYVHVIRKYKHIYISVLSVSDILVAANAPAPVPRHTQDTNWELHVAENSFIFWCCYSFHELMLVV